MKKQFSISILAAVLLIFACGGETDSDFRDTGDSERPEVIDSVIVLPDSPMEIALDFSNKLGMNDPGCFELISREFAEQLPLDSLSPQQIFGKWRAFDAAGRLTAIQESTEGMRTSYYCTIRRMEMPAINRIDFLLADDSWLIDAFGVELPRDTEDSLTIEQLANLVLRNPNVRREMHVIRMLYDDCQIDSVQSYASLNAAVASGTDFRDFLLDLQPESYSVLAQSNIRRAGKYQIMSERAEIGFVGLPADLMTLINIWREMGYISKSILSYRHEAMQGLYFGGIWNEPNVADSKERLTGFREFFLSVSDLVEARDSLSRTYPVLLTSGSNEPLAQVEIDLDPHQLEQKMENDVGIVVWRALAVELNGDSDPERVVYWAGNLFLFEGTPIGYRLVWRTYENYESDYHPDFVSQPSGRGNCREVTFKGVDGEYEYFLGYSDSGEPLFRRIRSMHEGSPLVEEQL